MSAAALSIGALRLLASVRSVEEASQALAAGAALIDAKEPRGGALGALPIDSIRAIVAAVAGRAPVSATVGDLPLEASRLAPAMLTIAAAGVDYVKIGLFGPPDALALRRCLADLPQRLPAAPGSAPARRIAVLMADQDGDRWPLDSLAEHGFTGVMLDTADKRCGGLRAVLSMERLLTFVSKARSLGLLTGLAGSLDASDIIALAPLLPNFLGFRTALCHGGSRAGRLDPLACHQLCAQLAALSKPWAQAGGPSRRTAQPARPR
jgi:dihydroneopterin aldolase